MPRTSLTNFPLSITVQGIPFDVKVDYSPPWRGSQDRFGVPLEPDDAADVNITSICVEGTGYELCDILYEGFLLEAEQEACEALIQRDQEEGYDG